jgi:hypothetical protein
MEKEVLELESLQRLCIDVQHLFHLLELFLLLFVVSHQHLLLLVELLTKTVTLSLQLLL